jgi:O-antigen ligase
MMLLWNAILHNNPQRWKLFGGGIALSYLVVSLISNQTVPEFYITHFSFDAESANFRILIWDFGSASALKHPWFGVSFGEWERPAWMPPSIDMFWLIHAVEHGIPAAILMIIGFLSACAAVGFRSGLNQKLASYRLGYLVTMTSFFVVGWTVDFWNATYVVFMFLVGSGLWLSDPGATPESGRKT